MKLPRRTFLHLAAGAAALPTISRVAWAQAYPSRPVTLIVYLPDPFLLHIYAALAEKERALISRRTKDALAAAKTRGIAHRPPAHRHHLGNAQCRTSRPSFRGS
jgi:hypothetical protein